MAKKSLRVVELLSQTQVHHCDRASVAQRLSRVATLLAAAPSVRTADSSMHRSRSAAKRSSQHSTALLGGLRIHRSAAAHQPPAYAASLAAALSGGLSLERGRTKQSLSWRQVDVRAAVTSVGRSQCSCWCSQHASPAVVVTCLLYRTCGTVLGECRLSVEQGSSRNVRCTVGEDADVKSSNHSADPC